MLPTRWDIVMPIVWMWFRSKSRMFPPDVAIATLPSPYVVFQETDIYVCMYERVSRLTSPGMQARVVGMVRVKTGIDVSFPVQILKYFSFL